MTKAATVLLCAVSALLIPSPRSAIAQQGFGEVAFANSGPQAAQPEFLLGLALLHNFEYEDAAEHFRQAQKIAPDFALAFWGEAMTQNHPIWHEEDVSAARQILNRLAPTPEARRTKAPTEREKLYLSSVEILFGEGSKEERDRRYESALAELHRQYPDDVDAAAFYALAILGTPRQGRDLPTYMRAAAVLEEVFPQHPRHPGVVHYLIHSYDDPVHAPLGLRAARIYSKIAPEAAHAQHMTSHIFLSLGMWDEVVKANETAIAVVNRAREKAGKPPGRCGHYNEWLEYGYLQQGRVADARRVLDGCRQAAERVAASSKPGGSSAETMSMSGMTPAMMLAVSYAGMRAHFLIDARLWNDEVARWSLPSTDFPIAQVAFDYTNALAALRRGDIPAAREAISRVDSGSRRALEWMIERKMDHPALHDVVFIYNGELQALLSAAQGKPEDAVRELRTVAERERAMPLEFGPPNIEKPADELLGEMLLEMKRPSEARDAFKAALARAPGRRLAKEELALAEKQAGSP